MGIGVWSAITACTVAIAAHNNKKHDISCQGATVTADGYGILFNNTKLASNDQGTDQLPAAIQLNGGLVYPGR